MRRSYVWFCHREAKQSDKEIKEAKQLEFKREKEIDEPSRLALIQPGFEGSHFFHLKKFGFFFFKYLFVMYISVVVGVNLIRKITLFKFVGIELGFKYHVSHFHSNTTSTSFSRIEIWIFF